MGDPNDVVVRENLDAGVFIIIEGEGGDGD